MLTLKNDPENLRRNIFHIPLCIERFISHDHNQLLLFVQNVNLPKNKTTINKATIFEKRKYIA